MKYHEWSERDQEAGERRYYRAAKFGAKWTFSTTLKSDPDWERLDPAPLQFLEELRSMLLNKYQRRRVPYEDIVAIDKMVAGAGGQRVTEDKS